ncbi:hypothetical protein [Candidatus Amarolinea dominans]|uniref:hypothetical protein n=1 Tax=Candidatus Amarolinea dominans TaxID=3140696 RepID=UPI0031CC79AE
MNRSTRNYLALDLGASGGRAIVGRFDGERLTLVELHRFANGPVQLPRADGGTSLHWNILGLFAEIKEGLRRAAAAGGRLTSLGIDTWGWILACWMAAANCSAIPTTIGTAAPMA